MRALLHISLLALTLLLGGLVTVETAFAQTPGIPPFDGPPLTQAQLYALGDTCANTPGATKRQGSFTDDADPEGFFKDKCTAESTETTLYCSYSSYQGRYSQAVFCTITYKNRPDPNTRRIDVNVLASDGTDEDVADQDDAANSTSVPSPSASCSMGDIPACLRNLPGMLFVGIAYLFLTLSAAILGVAGTIFNWVVIRTVFQFGEYFGTSAGMLDAWGIMRDVANIGLLFGFILMGVLLILNVDGGGHGHGHGGGISAKKAIPRLIIFAVLLNFSLFASQFVIDVSNAFSSSFATLAGEECSTKTSSGAASTADQTNADCANNGIAGRILQVSGMTALWDNEALDIESGIQNFVDRPYSYATSLMLLSVFVLITAMVLFAGAIMLVIRVVILTLLMITSPIGFAGMAIPKLEGIAAQWWNKLISQSFFAPVYLLLIFISVKMSEGLMEGNATLANALIANAGTSVAGNMQVVMVYLIVIGFMIGSLIAASKMGAMGAKFATQSAAAVTVGSVGFVGRRTVGRASARIANNIRSSSMGETEMGRRLAGVADYGAKSSFSLRNAGTNALKVGGVGLDLGKANKTAGHGYHGIEEKATKDRVDYAKTLKGPRGETDGELRERVSRETRDLETRRNNAATNVTAAQAEVSAAQEAQVTQKTHRNNVAFAVTEQQALVAKNPADPAARQRLSELEQQLTKESEELAGSNQKLAQANENLTKATKTRAEVMEEEVDQRRGYVEEKKRQENYARELDSHLEVKNGKVVNARPAPAPRSWYDLASGDHHLDVGHHARHEAARSIVGKANRSKLEKALDGLKEVVDESSAEKDHGAHDDHAAPAAGAANHGTH